MTMKATIFSNILKLISASNFNQYVKKYNANKWRKSFKCWDHLVVMIYQQLSSKKSLRALEAGFNSHLNAHYHLRISKPIKKSTVSEANNAIPHELYADLLSELTNYAKGCVKTELKEMIRIIDSSPIQLRSSVYDWAESNHRIKGLKVHTVYDPSKELGTHFVMTSAKINDITPAKQLNITPGTTYIFDKGYYDFNWWYKLNETGCIFVTRLKSNTPYHVVENRPVENSKDTNVISDEVVELTTRRGKCYRGKLRKIEVTRDNGTNIVIVSNDLDRDAKQIADLYKARWQIEVFFKWLKQNLKIKRFLGQSENAVKNQILIALITYVLVFIYKITNKIQNSMMIVFVVIKEKIFNRRPLVEYLGIPPNKPPDSEFKQMEFCF